MFKPEQIIGRHYKILSRLGAGGMGQVFKALDNNLGREVAIKFLLSEIAKEEELVKRFLNEGRILATINHPAVINVYASDVEESTGVPFLVMEFVDGKSLNEHKKALKSEPIALINHFIQLFSGIHACHQKGIVHRDLKPENVLINLNGQLKLVDFGIAKTASRNTKTGIAMGTPHYMSPEQCLGKQDITAKTDVYAAGIMLYEILLGKLPFTIDGHADDPALAIALMHLNDTPDYSDFAELPQGSSFQGLISRMLAKKPDQRPEIPEILEDLKQILNRLRMAQTGGAGGPAPEVNIIGEIYQIEKELGCGGMGKVFKALDTSLNRTVAIKVLHESTLSNNSLIERFIKEGQTLATVGHRNVMGIYASSRDKNSGRPFLVMEYIEGKPLSDLIQAINKDCRQAVPVMLQLAEGISACHERNIIHRDLKPGNIIITPEGLVKILDFGIAKTQASLTKTGMTVGTPEYMSPEQCVGSKNISGKSDIYSLGIIFWELIFGAVPYKPDTSQNAELSVALKHIEATLPAQAAIPDITMVPIIGLVRRMLDKDPAARPAIHDIIDTLENHLSEHAPEALPRANTGRRSIGRAASSSLSGLVKAVDAEQGWKKYVMPAALAILLGGGGLAYKFGYLGTTGQPDQEALINLLIQQRSFNEARKIIDEFSISEAGRQKAPAIKQALSQAMINSADEAERQQDFLNAINLYAQAIALDPANPRAALTLSRLQQEKEKHDRQKLKIETLNKQALLLLEIVEPASGTRELAEIMQELASLGMATNSAEVGNAWKARFINKGEESIATNPQKSLVYFVDLQKYFAGEQKIGDLIAQAEKQSKLLEEQLTQTTMLNTLKASLEAAIDNYVPGQKPDFICQQILKVQELGDAATADALSLKLAEKIAREADNWIANNPEKAIELFNSAKLTCPTLTGLDTKLQLAEESLVAMRSSEELKKERDLLANSISKQIRDITPPAAIEEILAQLEKLATYGEGNALVETHRESLYQKYFSAVSDLLDKSPDAAQAALKVCMQIKPAAPGLAEVEEKIKQRVAMESELKASRELEEIRKKQEKATNEVFAFIKKARLPGDSAAALEKIAEIARGFPNTDAAAKLEQLLLTRCRNDLKNLEQTDPEKAVSLTTALQKSFTQHEEFSKELADLLPRLEQKSRIAREEAEKKALADAEAKVKAEEEAKIKAELDAKAKIEADAKAKIEAEARAKSEAEAKAKADADAKIKADADAKVRIEAEAKARADAEAKARLEEQAKASQELTVGAQGTYKTINEAVSAAKDGATIKILPGTYNEAIEINKSITLKGEAAGKCMVSAANGPTFTLSGMAKISGLTIANSSSKTSPSVLISNGNIEVSNCIVSNATPAIAPDYVAAISIIGGRAKVNNNQITGSKGMGIKVLGGSPEISGNSISGCEIYGIWFNGPSKAIVSGNTIRKNGKSGVGIKAGASPDFTGNTLIENGQNGMLIYADGAGKIENNRISDNKLAGIEVWDAQPQSISNNTIENNREDAILVRGKKAAVRLGKNQFKGNRGEEVKNSGGKVTSF